MEMAMKIMGANISEISPTYSGNEQLYSENIKWQRDK